jgi:hypothetical protein
MGLVAVTAALFTPGAYLARNLSDGGGVGFWIAEAGGATALFVAGFGAAGYATWWFLSLGVLWTLLGTYVLSYRVGSLAAVAALVAVALLFGGVSQLAVPKLR